MSSTDLFDAAQHFISRYHADEHLCAGQVDWDCTLSLQAHDSGQRVTIRIERGRAQVEAGDAIHTDLVVTSTQSILLDILNLNLNPNQPYVFGELTVTGREADFTRVDYVATTLCAGA